MPGSDTREQILLTAFREFMRSSYRDVTMSQLVEVTGLSKGAFYHHFKGKQELFEATVEMFFDLIHNNMLGEPDRDISFRDFFFEMMTRYDERMVELIDRTGCRELGHNNYRFIFNAVEYYPGFMQKVTRMHEAEHGMWRAVIEKAKERGELRPDVNARLAARHISVMLDGIGAQTLFVGRPDLMGDWIEELFEQFYGLLRR
jgi:AcrR family transcriptional regulator